MDHKQSANILISMLKRLKLKRDEKQAVLNAIGVLSWTSLSGSRIKSLKAKREKSIDWNARIVPKRGKRNAWV